MQFVRHGDFLTAVRITGPSRNLLSLRLGAAIEGTPSCEALAAADGRHRTPLDQSEIVRQVLAAAARANSSLRTSYAVLAIRYVEDDSPPESTYGLMTRTIIEHLHGGGLFVSSQP